MDTTISWMKTVRHPQKRCWANPVEAQAVTLTPHSCYYAPTAQLHSLRITPYINAEWWKRQVQWFSGWELWGLLRMGVSILSHPLYIWKPWQPWPQLLLCPLTHCPSSTDPEVSRLHSCLCDICNFNTWHPSGEYKIRWERSTKLHNKDNNREGSTSNKLLSKFTDKGLMTQGNNFHKFYLLKHFLFFY